MERGFEDTLASLNRPSHTRSEKLVAEILKLAPQFLGAVILGTVWHLSQMYQDKYWYIMLLSHLLGMVTIAGVTYWWNTRVKGGSSASRKQPEHRV
jgi:hypothetical protein